MCKGLSHPHSLCCVQSAVRLRGSPVEQATILDVSGSVPAAVVQGLLAAARSPHFSRIQQAVTDLIADGYPAQEILLQLQEALLADTSTSDAGGWVAWCLGAQVAWWGAAAVPAAAACQSRLATVHAAQHPQHSAHSAALNLHPPFPLPPPLVPQPRAASWCACLRRTRTWWMALTSSCSCWVQPALRSAHWPRPHTAEPRLLLPCLRSGVAALTCSSCNYIECWDECAHACMES